MTISAATNGRGSGDGMTDMEADLAIAQKRITELEAQIEQARLEVCGMCRLLRMKTKIVFSCSMCIYGWQIVEVNDGRED